jgi:DNA gyrase/topoisomerase IV subunit B
MGRIMLADDDARHRPSTTHRSKTVPCADPETRTILQVTVEDAFLANDTFERLMGDDVEPCRLFIEENAKFVRSLDI